MSWEKSVTNVAIKKIGAQRGYFYVLSVVHRKSYSRFPIDQDKLAYILNVANFWIIKLAVFVLHEITWILLLVEWITGTVLLNIFDLKCNFFVVNFSGLKYFVGFTL